MKTILYCLFMLFACFNLAPAKDEMITARITYYSGDKHVAWSKVKNPVYGVSLASHPNFKFGTKVTIPALKGKVDDGEFTVHDRGPDVTKKKASGGKAYVFDVFCSSRNQMKKLASSMPHYMKVIVHR